MKGNNRQDRQIINARIDKCVSMEDRQILKDQIFLIAIPKETMSIWLKRITWSA